MLRGVSREILANAANSPKWLHRSYEAIERARPVIYVCAVFSLALRMQKYTSDGRFVTHDDDFVEHQPLISQLFEVTVFVILTVLQAGLHLACALAEDNVDDDDEPKRTGNTVDGDDDDDVSARRRLVRRRLKNGARRVFLFLAETYIIFIAFVFIFVWLNNLIILHDAVSTGRRHFLEMITFTPSGPEGRRGD